MVLEIKDPRALKPTIALVRAIHASPLPFISSFSSSVIRRVKQSVPSLTTALIIERPQADWVHTARKAHANMVHAAARLATKKRITAAQHREGLPVWAWTVNTKHNALQLKKRGIDGIFTDELPQLISLL